MDIKTTIRTLMHIPPRKSVMLLGNHGLGKSSMIYLVARLLSQLRNKPYWIIDFRLAQLEPGDLVGMMRHVAEGLVTRQMFVNGVLENREVRQFNYTQHDLADWFPTDPDSCGFLFLDELFKAPRDVQNAVLELSLDYKFHFKELPMGWNVVSANNDDMSVYSGAFAEPALFDRWLKIYFKPTPDEWLTYAKNEKAHKAVIEYIQGNPRDLMLDRYTVGEIGPSPRSWMHLSDWMLFLAEQGDDPLKDLGYLQNLAAGYLGTSLANSFTVWVQSKFTIFTAEDIIENFPDQFTVELAKMDTTEMDFYTVKLLDYFEDKKITSLNRKQIENLHKYMKALPREVQASFWSKFTSKNRKLAANWYKDPAVMETVMSMLEKNKELKGG